MTTKFCPKCEKQKFLSEFSRDKTASSGYCSHCKACKKAYRKARAATPEGKAAYKKSRDKYYGSEKNKERMARKKEESKNWHPSTLKRCAECELEKPISDFHSMPGGTYGVRGTCKTCNNARCRAYASRPEVKEARRKRDQTPEGRLKQRKYDKSPSRRAKKLEWERRQRAENPFFAIKSNMSRAIRHHLTKEGGSKFGKTTLDCLPYTIEKLKEHLESQFDDKMSWENYGSYWHIDHKFPQSRLPYDSIEHPNFKKAWSLENLQPLEAIENIKKGDKLPDEWGQ